MEQKKMDRISELTRSSRERELTEAEQREREVLRREYLDDWKRGAEATLSSTYIVDANGIKRPLKKKK